MRVRRLLLVGAILAGALAATAATVAFGSGKNAAAVNSTGCQLGNGIKHVIEITFDNVALQPGQPECPLRPRADAGARELHQAQRDAALEQPHAAHRPHGGRHASRTTPASTATAKGMGITNTTRLYSSGRHLRDLEVVVRLLDGHLRSRRVPEPCPTRRACPPRARRRDAARAVGAVHPRRLRRRRRLDGQHGAGEHEPGPAERIRAGLARGGAVNADTDTFKDQETNDYLGLAVHCASGDASVRTPRPSSTGRPSPSPTAVTDSLPSEPGGYTGFQAVFGHRYLTARSSRRRRTPGCDRAFGNGHSYPGRATGRAT